MSGTALKYPSSKFQCPVCGRMVFTWTHVENCRRSSEIQKRDEQGAEYQ